MHRIIWYVILNVAFSLAVAIAALSGSTYGVHPLYVILLFALCTSFVVNIRHWNDRYALLALFSAVYFEFYGVIDVEQLFGLYPALSAASTTGVLSTAELVILCGGALAQIGYRLACRYRLPPDPRARADWSESSLLTMGLPLFVICTALNWVTHVYLFPTNDSATEAAELAKIGNLGMLVLTFADMLQPLSMLLIFYALCVYRRRILLPIALAVVVVQAIYGFVIDVKGEVLLGGVLMMFTKIFVDGRLPKLWLLSFAVCIALLFPALQANRVVRGESNIDHTQAASNILQTFEQAYAARKDVTTGENRTQSFFERSSLKGSVEMIVAGTGTRAPYQHGYTLSPMIAAFIPKVIWPNKPDVPVGRLLNEQFHVTDDPDTYISPSHLGELYWNFGWSGIVAGMSAIGLLLGCVGARCDLSASVTLTRTLIVAVTTQLLILGFESSISNQYVVWARVMLAVAVLHLIFVRRVPGSESFASDSPAPLATTAAVARPIPNLMT